MSSLLILFACLALGMVVARWARPPPGMAAGINWWVIQIALPALVLALIPQIRIEARLWFLVAANWLVFVGSWLLMALLGRRWHWQRGRIGALTLVAGLGNTAFMGYPLIEALRGHEALGLAVIADQAGCFTALAIGGVAVTAVYAGERLRPLQVLRRIVLFPSILALLVGVVVGRFGGWPAPVQDLLTRIGATLTPLAMFSVGLQQRCSWSRSQWQAMTPALLWKLLLAPLLCWSLGRLSGIRGLVLDVGVLQAAMPSMVSATILADQYELEPPLANAVLGIGILLSLLTVPAINSRL